MIRRVQWPFLSAAGMPAEPDPADRAPADFISRVSCQSFRWGSCMALTVQRDPAQIADMQPERAVSGVQSADRAQDFDAVILEFIVGNSLAVLHVLVLEEQAERVGLPESIGRSALDGIRRSSTDADTETRFETFSLRLSTTPAISPCFGETARAVAGGFR